MEEDDDQPPPPHPVLLLISHARTPPLRKVPDLTYDLRAAHNPPKQMRDKFTGVDKRLREHMLGHGDFAALLDRAEGEIKALIRKMTEGDVEGGVPPLREWRPPRGRRPWEVRNEEREEDEGKEGLDGEGEGGDVDEEEEEEEEERPTLRVGMFCVRGRHRSVAFAEELGQREWPREWEVRVVHRDLGRSNRKGSLGGKRGFNRRDSLGRGFLDEEDD
ncbi:hypothetical protein NKR19_g9719 [Coniochaeta hoffmannii]|uniref:RapZ C-terminal domain-containing protein n=1 Tax=Coniochaeta hoffmannii TaxID=91930 RepID=A0AA38R2M1_9PEZI|nr:hypothetical protein NKR19_g9719 [Coniochaeta hoffmannii]